jgi:hypothetical protein
MYVNRKNEACLKLFWEWGGRGMKENEGGGKFKYDMFDIL